MEFMEILKKNLLLDNYVLLFRDKVHIYLFKKIILKGSPSILIIYYIDYEST